MKLFEFEKYFPTEEICRAKFKEMRDKEGVACSKCGCVHHAWLPSKEQYKYRCKKCNHYTALRADTVMRGSKLPFRHWFLAMHLLTATRHAFPPSKGNVNLGMRDTDPFGRRFINFAL